VVAPAAVVLAAVDVPAVVVAASANGTN